MMTTRSTALDSIRGYRLGSRCLVEQGLRHSGEFEDGVTSHDKDIDFWAASADRKSVVDLFAATGAFRLASSSHRDWLNHDVYLVPCSDGQLLVDVKFGDLKVGPLTILTEADLLDSLDENDQFTGAAMIADLILRRLARGKSVDATRLNIARVTWEGMDRAARKSALEKYTGHLGPGTSRRIQDLLEENGSQEPIVRSLRMRVLHRCFNSLDSSKIAISKLASNIIGVLTRRPRPFGQYQIGSLVVISGTDGVGKSTTLDNVADEVRACGLRCRTFYLGRGRGNVPGVAALRNLVGRKVKNGNSVQDVYRVPTVNKLACWLYAFEYAVRTLKPRFLARVLGQVVLCDRYCYDIALVPGASARAVAFARVLCPTPDMNVVLYAPTDVILARKAERSVAAIEKQQAILAQIIDAGHARRFSTLIDTSKTGETETYRQIVYQIFQLTYRGFA